MIDLERIRRESIRWHILNTLNVARPIGASEEDVLSVIQAVYPNATAHELRRELDYLSVRMLVRVEKAPHGRWHAALSRLGVDIAEYTVECEPGINRPAKYW